MAAWITETVIVSWRAFHQEHRPPLPSEFVAAFVLYGALGLIAESPTARPAATALGWGLVVATALRLGPADFNAAASNVTGTPAGRAAGTPADGPVSAGEARRLQEGRK